MHISSYIGLCNVFIDCIVSLFAVVHGSSVYWRRFNHIVVDRVQATVGSVRRVLDVVFLSALEGVIHKYVILRGASTSAVVAAHSEACLMQRITIAPSHQTVASLTLDERNVRTRTAARRVIALRF